MEKDFDRWNHEKKRLNAADARLYFHDGEIWWAHLGINVGFEIDGKRSDFSRPVIILKKYNQFSFLALPLTTNAKASPSNSDRHGRRPLLIRRLVPAAQHRQRAAHQ